jgi:cation transport ATPase
MRRIFQTFVGRLIESTDRTLSGRRLSRRLTCAALLISLCRVARKPQPLDAQAERLRADGATVINIAIDGRLAGIFAIADPVKQSTPDALKALAAEGIKVIMLTEDNRTTANAVARQLGIADVEAEVFPDQKSAVVSKLQEAGHIVAMAGDGVKLRGVVATQVAIQYAGGVPGSESMASMHHPRRSFCAR